MRIFWLTERLAGSACSPSRSVVSKISTWSFMNLSRLRLVGGRESYSLGSEAGEGSRCGLAMALDCDAKLQSFMVMATDATTLSLGELRQQLDKTDEDIVRLLARRLETVSLIGKAKAEHATQIRDPGREREVLARVEALANSLGISGPLTRKIFSEVIDYSVSRQVASLVDSERRPVSVAYQGQPLTYNQLAAEQYIASRDLHGHFVGLATLNQVVEQLTSGQVDLAFLPIENTVAGSMNQVYDVLRERDLHIVGEDSFRIELCLASVADVPLPALRRIYSHPLALEQCSAFTDSLPQAQTTPFADSRDAMRAVAEAKDPTLAAIGSSVAARAHGLVILRSNIGNQAEILMRYVALAREPLPVDELSLIHIS